MSSLGAGVGDELSFLPTSQLLLSDRNLEFKVNSIVTSWELGQEGDWPVRSKPCLYPGYGKTGTDICFCILLYLTPLSQLRQLYGIYERRRSLLHRSPGVVRVVKSGEIQQAGHVARARKTSNCMKMTAFWDIVPCSLVKTERRFRVAYCLNRQGDKCLSDRDSRHL
jgi:hypothetical protein